MCLWTTFASAAPYAAMVMDARTGEVLHSRNADTRLHPASLTKMMTLYIAFEAVERGEISLDTPVLISKKAASEPPSKLGLKAGQRIALRYLIRAAAIKSANDAATAIGEAIEGSEAAFARRMNRTAKALGMTRSTFKNAHGLTEAGHLSTAHDMTIMGRRLFYDYPEYYNLFSRVTTDAGIARVSNTNRRLLSAYRGADGIKTGYTRAAGFNLVASAERGGERIIATVFGGNSVASRNAQVAELLDLGFQRAPSRVAVRRPDPPVYEDDGAVAQVASASGLVDKSPRPRARPASEAPPAELLLALQDGIDAALAEAIPLPEDEGPETGQGSLSVTPKPRPDIVLAAAEPNATDDEVAVEENAREVVTRISTSGGRHWAINVGHYTTRHEAERVLLQTALTELSTLDDALRKVVNAPKGWQANFVGLSEDEAGLVCRRLVARNMPCEPMGPG